MNKQDEILFESLVAFEQSKIMYKVIYRSQEIFAQIRGQLSFRVNYRLENHEV